MQSLLSALLLGKPHHLVRLDDFVEVPVLTAQLNQALGIETPVLYLMCIPLMPRSYD